MIMTFADYVVGMAGVELQADMHQVTIQLDVQFVTAAEIGELLIGHSEVVRATSSLLFLRGTIAANGRMVATASGIWKRVRPPEFTRSSRDVVEETA
jgi:acyl-coenzyme A thioesterase PaaI-like protein